MAGERVTGGAGDYLRTFVSQQGRHFRHERQEIGPAIKRVEEIRHMHEYATKQSNPNGWRHVGSIPMTILIDWLRENGYTIDQWARNDGGEGNKSNPRGGGVKDKFMRFFLSRDFSKLHNNHVTTRRGAQQILMPGDRNATRKLRGTES